MRSGQVKLLAIYLNDHLAGATGGLALARRALGANRGNRFGELLERLAEEIKDDRQTLRAVMRALDVREDPIKRVAALAGERVGRLKLNGSLRSYSPLSRLLELEALGVGVDAKRSLWRSLEQLDDPRLADFDFRALGERAERQREQLEEHRLEAGRIAFAG